MNTQTQARQPKQEIVTLRRCTLSLTVAELRDRLGLPRDAHLYVIGEGVRAELAHGLELKWLEWPGDGAELEPRVTPASLPASLPAPQVEAGEHDEGPRPWIACPVDTCEGRRIYGQGPFASHVRWHESKGHLVPAHAYELAGGIKPRAGTARRRS
jgi:hypothetical protein